MSKPEEVKKEVLPVSLEQAIAMGLTIKVADGLYVGPVKDPAPKAERIKSPRKLEEYEGEPPRGERGKHITFEIEERCGLTVKDKDGKDYTCEEHLLVVRVKNTKFEWDKAHAGGQLIYDEDDIRQFKYCPNHGPFREEIPTKW